MSGWAAPVYASLGGSWEGLVRRMSPGGWALGGERTLWTGRPAHCRVTLADAGLALYVTAALVVLVVLGLRWMRGVPEIAKVTAVIAWGGGAIQALGMLSSILVTGPRKQRRTVYEVTNYRVIVTSGPGTGDAASVYLDQLDEPAVRRSRDGTENVLLRARSGGTQQSQRLTRLFQQGRIGLAAVNPVTVLRAVPDAEQASRVIAEARRRMRDGETDAFRPAGHLAGPAAPGEITLEAGEDVLWAGGPARIPWWFGRHDVYLTVFVLAWLSFAAGMCILTVQSGSTAFLVFLVPLALAGGVYPAAGRVVHRRLRIRRSRYVLTSRRLITTWRPLGGGPPVVVQARLGALLPPVLLGSSVFTGLASPNGSSQRRGWKELTWPATTVPPPAFIALADAREVAALIGAAQVAARARRGRTRSANG
jgi:hypothetical protein